jgi:hypothetical protein
MKMARICSSVDTIGQLSERKVIRIKSHIYTGPAILKNLWFFKIDAISDSTGLYSLIVGGVI